MSSNYTNEPMLDMYIFETTQQIELLEQNILDSEKESSFTEEMINDIFRIMHTIKGSSAMMMFNDIATLAHSVEDIFYYLRDEKPSEIDYNALCDMIFEGIDFIKIEIEKIKNNDQSDGNSEELCKRFKNFLEQMKNNKTTDGIVAEAVDSEYANELKDNVGDKNQQFYISQDKSKINSNKNIFKAIIHYDPGCEMENIRAFTLIHNLKELTNEIYYYPSDIIDNDNSIETIREEGF